MKWSFGIITDGHQWNRVREICYSIREEDNGYYDDQIIVVGGTDMPISIDDFYGVIHIPFNETEKKGWITKKKNIIAKIALHNNICLMHDYVILQDGWHKGFEDYGDDWLTCMTHVHNKNGSRFRDWCVIYNDAWMKPPIDDQEPPKNAPPGLMMDWSTRGHERWQYYSGAYFCAKKKVMEKVPLDETRLWGQGEDVQWSRLVYKEYGSEVFQFNPYSDVKFLKQKDNAPWQRLSEL